MKRPPKILFPFFVLMCFWVLGCHHQNENKPKDKTSLENTFLKTENVPQRDSLLQQALVQNEYGKAYRLQLKEYRANYSTYGKKELKSVLERLRELAQLSKNDKFIAQSDYKTAHFYKDEELSDSAYYYYYSAQKLYRKMKDSLGLAKSYISLGRIQTFSGDYFGAAKNEINALVFLNTDQKRYRLAAYNILAITAKKQKKYDEAIEWYDKALGISPNSKYAPLIEVNKASVFLLKNENQVAHRMFARLSKEKILTLTDERRSMVLDYFGLAKARLYLKNGLAMMQEAKTIRKKANLNGGLVMSYLHLAGYFKNSNKFVASNYAQKAVALTKNPDKKLWGLKLISETSPKQSKKAFHRYIELSDSVVSARSQAANKFAKIRFESAQNEKKILQLKTKTAGQALFIQHEKNTKTLYLIAILFLGVLGSLIVIFLRVRHQKNKKLAISNTETKLSKRVHDEVANAVYQLMDAVQYKTGVSNERILDNLEKIYTKSRNISREIKSLDLLKNYAENLRKMIGSYGTSEVNVFLRNFDPQQFNELSDDQKICVFRVLQELMTNMKKHSQADLVLVLFQKNEKNLKINYRDNGKGFSRKTTGFDGSGLQNVENRIISNKGSLNFDHSSKKGVSIILQFFF